ncbi:MAG: type II toxin-antitoxin system MqsA family antitoxin [Candidatus Competibacteraceae bacterium]
MTTAKQCPICTTGELAFFQEPDQIQYKGKTLSVEVEYAVCQHCGEEMILPDQIKRNDCRVRDAWRKADGLLTGAEIAELRQKLRLTQQEAAKVFGGGVNAFSKYERGEVIQSEGMDKLMRLALEKKPIRVYKWLRERAGLPTVPLANTENGYDNEILQFPNKKPLLKLESANEPFFVEKTEGYRNVSNG